MWSPPLMDTRNPKGVASALPASWVELEYLNKENALVESVVMKRRVNITSWSGAWPPRALGWRNFVVTAI
ncbi:hypothetical protein EVAR_70891_1 [Eumeta japonica]|uniref:Uncharacterized protein n=1 Tax=Eumeta variegata TaxID=151549 RepID=A0A4C1SAB7_EUMVA|nr:hypothetical protein EVAR_70891_1 [Eumeta japonica]